jgi:3'(2'), 5'-bisphosphate nucleotidase
MIQGNEKLKNVLIDLAVQCSSVAMEIYASDFDVHTKDDQSPVTLADIAVNKIICATLGERFPDIPIVTEESSESFSHGANADRFFLVDPIDGTREFVNKTDEFTVNIALIENGDPVAGMIAAPALGRIFYGDVEGGAVEIDAVGKSKPIHARTASTKVSDWTAFASRSHLSPETTAFLEKLGVDKTRSAGSSLKFCLLACGEADIYPRFGRTMEWDIAAGHAILRSAGGDVRQEYGQKIRYGKLDLANPDFIAYGTGVDDVIFESRHDEAY